MTRAEIRRLKRQMHSGMRPGATDAERHTARESASALLRRSVAMNHERLLLLRLADAMKLGAPIDAKLWDHCIGMLEDPARLALLQQQFPALPRLLASTLEQRSAR